MEYSENRSSSISWGLQLVKSKAEEVTALRSGSSTANNTPRGGGAEGVARATNTTNSRRKLQEQLINEFPEMQIGKKEIGKTMHKRIPTVAICRCALTCGKALCLLALVELAIFSVTAEANTPGLRPLKVNTRFLAASTSTRQTWGANEDVFLAQIALHSGSQPVLVRLIDEYWNLFPPLSAATLTAASGTTLRLRRDTRCDMPYGKMQLRTAPGDPMAILHERLGYRPQFPRTPEPEEILPCYRTAR